MRAGRRLVVLAVAGGVAAAFEAELEVLDPPELVAALEEIGARVARSVSSTAP